MQTIRLAGIGTGFRFRQLGRCALGTGQMELKALCDTSIERAEETRAELDVDATILTDHREVLESSDIDAVIISVPNVLHAPITIDALAAGKHVLCEKPMASTVADAARVVGAADASDRVMMVSLQMRYHGWCSTVKELVAGGKIGKPRMAWCTEWREPFPESMSWVFTKSKSGGAIVEKNCHHFDLFNWWTEGRPAFVAAFGGIGPSPQMLGHGLEVVDHAYITAEYDNDVRAMVGVCFFGSHGIGRDMGITGDEGTLLHTRRDQVTSLTFYPREGDWERIELSGDDGNRLIMERFAAAVRGEADPFPTARMGYDSILGPAAAEIAMAEKRVVPIEEIDVL